MSKVSEAQTEIPATQSPTRKKRTPWARRRELDLGYYDRGLEKTKTLIKNIEVAAFEKHGVDRDNVLLALATAQGHLKALCDQFARLPDEFPPSGTRTRAVSKGFVEGARVQIRENRQEKYAGAFDASQDLTVGPGAVGGGFVPVKTQDGATFFVPQAHLMHVTE